MDVIKSAKNVFNIEIDTLEKVRDSLGDSFESILKTIMCCEGKVVLCGPYFIFFIYMISNY